MESSVKSEQPVALPHPFGDLIGLDHPRRGEGRSLTELVIEDKHKNPHGVVHGAVVYALADTGMGSALMSALDEGQYCTTIEIKISYFRPGLSGKLTCNTWIVNRGRRTAALQSEVHDDAGKLLASATGTFMILEQA